jgi:hypothetical protein
MSGRVGEKRSCALLGCGPCSDGLTREHYISASVLRQIAADDGSLRVSGAPWSPDLGRPFRVNALTARILCQRHNSQLSGLDAAAASICAALRDADRELTHEGGESWVRPVSGLLLERWLLKVTFGLWSSGNLMLQGDRYPGKPPRRWGPVLLGLKPFPRRWGLYIEPQIGEIIARGELVVDAFFHGSTIKAARIGIAGFQFTFATVRITNPSNPPIYHPIGIALRRDNVVKTIHFDWPKGPVGEMLRYTRTRVGG